MTLLGNSHTTAGHCRAHENLSLHSNMVIWLRYEFKWHLCISRSMFLSEQSYVYFYLIWIWLYIYRYLPCVFPGFLGGVEKNVPTTRWCRVSVSRTGWALWMPNCLSAVEGKLDVPRSQCTPVIGNPYVSYIARGYLWVTPTNYLEDHPRTCK